MISRRNSLYLIAAAGVGYAGFRMARPALEPDLVFAALDDPQGFRSFGGGDYSGGAFNAFVGLETDEDLGTEQFVTEQDIRNDICAALYEPLGPPDGRVRIASFSDYYCPFCRVQTRNLSAIEKQYENRVAIAWHELPLLGEASETAARAAMAARRQNRYVEFQEQLIRTPFVANAAYIEALSDSIGVDHSQLVEDMASDALTRDLQTSEILASIFGFVGTPAMIIGRTVIMGQITDRQILAIVAAEENEPQSGIC